MIQEPFYSGDRPLEIGIFDNPVSYRQGYSLQQELHREVAAGEIPDQLLLLEHTPVYTVGKRGDDADFLLSPELLKGRGAEVVEIDRGGQITYHGPGQIVLYIISNMGDRARSIRRFVSCLEQVVIDYLVERYGIESARDAKHPGVWVGEEKIAALGISIHGKTTMHGFALNISTELSEFEAIVPCGIRDRGVCSVASLLARSPGRFPGTEVPEPGNLQDEMELIGTMFRETFGYSAGEATRIH
jgi:lipoyl(octanoyl) transferase